ncbi:PKD domain-containing protein [Angustibacter luteus]|uniref:PKD domain-containing protein n=1 Tax=Angustibacter luteus TaxID=658456 RepID=A0ABW1JBM2_9ACTN
MSSAIARAAKTFTLATVAAVLAVTALVALPAGAAHADTTPPAGTVPTVSADALPTVQVNGVVWSQVIVGNTVYAGGSFTSARPAGSPAGTNETPRNNLLAYNLQTGALITSFAPNLNRQVLTVAASPDGSRIYVGGDFTTANGVNRYRIAAYSTATGALITTFNPGTDYKVRTLVATNTTVYAGGGFSSAGAPRSRLAAFRASDGAVTSWAPVADKDVMSMVLTPAGDGMVLAGNFGNMNGQQARGSAKVDLNTGASMPWAMNATVQNWGTDAAMLSLTTDGQQIFGSGYVYGSNGNLEGIVAADPTTGAINWIDDCHGDTYWVWAGADAVYGVGHSHYCGNIGQFPQTTPWSFQRAMAFTKDAKTTVTNDPYGYYNWAGYPAPDLLRWWPTLDAGSFTGQTQAAWTVTGNSDYVVMGGEFPRVNGVAQQGIVRFAKRSIAPNVQGPVVKGAALNPNAVSLSSGSVRVAWPANWDRDNEELSYDLVRDNDTAHPIYTGKQKSTFWLRPPMGFIDRGLVNGSTHRYRLVVTDPLGNTATSENVTVVVNGGAASAYADGVLADGASQYWRLGESSATTAYNSAGFDDLTLGAGVTRGAAGGTGDADKASTFNGTDTAFGVNSQPVTAPDTFSAEAWFKTTTTSGGKILGFGGSTTGLSGNYDRHVYMTNDGKLTFGTWLGFPAIVTSAQSYNDGQWHHVVGTLGSAGEFLYVDGKRVGANGGIHSGQPYDGYWRIGGDNIGGWPGDKSSNGFQGDIDDVAIYPSQLTFAQVRSHYSLSGRTLPGTRPADTYGQAVYDAEPDLYWRLGDAAGTAVDSTPNGQDGAYTGGVTQGGPSAVTGGPTGSATFDGSTGGVYSSQQANNPQTFTEELWFRTGTHVGGKLIGFGNTQAGYSSGYDRHVYMEDDGRLTFGTWLGFTNTVSSPLAYNDNSWHHMVAEGSSSGLKLYVDGGLVASNSTGGAQDYAGYWRIGGDSDWGGTSAYFNGDLDEVAVYSSLLTDAQVSQHYSLGKGIVPNQSPTAAFGSTTTDLKVDFDATGSHDPDGTIAGYAWDFGDGAHDTGATPSHTYADPGTHQVVLTVTDNQGATAQVTQAVVTTAPNQAPTAAFTATPTNLSVAFDGSTSHDGDGSVVSYAWNFGDGATDTGITTSHTYTDPGTYVVKLTVADDDGATNLTQQSVVVTAPANVNPVAAFTVTKSNLHVAVNATTSHDPDGSISSYEWSFGDGSTDTGVTSAHDYAAGDTYVVTLKVTDNRGGTNTTTQSVTVAPAPANVPPTAAFTATPTDLTASFDASGSADPDGSVVAWSWTFGDSTTGSGKITSHPYSAPGTYPVVLTVTDNQGATATKSGSVTVTAPVVNPFYAQDLFGRTVVNGLGTADKGGPWTLSGGNTNFSVASGQARLKLAKAGSTVTANLDGVSATSTEVVVDVVADSAQTGGGTFIGVTGRKVGANTYAAKVKLLADGRVNLSLVSVVGTTETALRSLTVTGLTNSPSTPLRIRLQVFGTTPTTVRAKIWPVGGTEPTAWTASATDSSATLQAAGSVGLNAYLSGTSTNVPENVIVDNFAAGPLNP